MDKLQTLTNDLLNKNSDNKFLKELLTIMQSVNHYLLAKREKKSITALIEEFSTYLISFPNLILKMSKELSDLKTSLDKVRDYDELMLDKKYLEDELQKIKLITEEKDVLITDLNKSVGILESIVNNRKDYDEVVAEKKVLFSEINHIKIIIQEKDKVILDLNKQKLELENIVQSRINYDEITNQKNKLEKEISTIKSTLKKKDEDLSDFHIIKNQKITLEKELLETKTRLKENDKIFNSFKSNIDRLSSDIFKTATHIDDSNPWILIEKKRRKQSITNSLSVKIIIRPKNSSTTTDTKDFVLSHIDFTRSGININFIKSIKDNKILIEFRDKSHFKIFNQIFYSHIDLQQNYEFKELIKEDPRIIVFGVRSELSNEELEEQIFHQNKNIFDSFKIKILSSFNTRNGKNIIFKVNSSIYSKLMQDKKIYVSHQRLNLDEYFNVKLCKNCGKYGHLTRLCKNSKICSNCGDVNHIRDNCDKETSCCNCTNHNNKFKTSFDIKHNLFSRKCSVFQKVITNLSLNINYE